MPRNIIYITILLIIALLGVILFIGKSMFYKHNNLSQNNSSPNHSNMELTSPEFNNFDKIPSKYTCDGEDISPPLSFDKIPEGTKSLALILDDPDAVAGDWVHWLLWNIDPNQKTINENSVPQNTVQGTTSFGKPGYGGPCPPSGTHRYQFKLYALDTNLNLESQANKKDLENAMEGHILDQTTLVGLYQRG